MALVAGPGLNLGVHLRGGVLVEAKTARPADLGQLRASLGRLELDEVSLQSADSDDRVAIRIERQPGGEAAQIAAAEQVKSALSAEASGVEF